MKETNIEIGITGANAIRSLLETRARRRESSVLSSDGMFTAAPTMEEPVIPGGKTALMISSG